MKGRPVTTVQCRHCNRLCLLSDVTIERNVKDNSTADVICRKCQRKEKAGHGKG